MEAAQPTCAPPAGRDDAGRAQSETKQEPSTLAVAGGEPAAGSTPATPGENQAPGSLQTVQLEVKVVELERKIAELERAVQDERKVHSLQFSAKTSMIDALRIKVNRLEFAIKEAIIFLSKPLEKMQSVMTSGIQKGAGGRAPASSRAGDAKKQEQAGKTKKAGDARQAAQQQPLQSAPLFSPLESECLECMRFSIQYLEKAQAATSHISPAGHAKPGVALGGFPERRASEDESMPLSSLVVSAGPVPCSGEPAAPSNVVLPGLAVGPPVDAHNSNHSIWLPPKAAAVTTAAQKGGTRVTAGDGDTASDATAVRKESVHVRSKSAPLGAETAPATLAPAGQFEDTASGDIGETPLGSERRQATRQELSPTGPQGSAPGKSQPRGASAAAAGGGLGGSRCPNCRELLLQIDRHHDIETDLTQEIEQLEQRLTHEQQALAQMTLSKQLLEQEMEDLTASLFEQANRMVMEESAMRDALEKKNKELEGKLESTVSAVAKREEELKVVRKSLKEDLVRRRSLSRGPSSMNLIIDAANAPTGAFGRRSPSRGSSQLSLGSIKEAHDGADHAMRLPRFALQDVKDPNAVHLDGAAYNEFQEHIKAAAKATASTYATLGTSFLKRVMVEDIEPCLFQGSSAWKMPFYRNRLLLAIIKDTIEIRHWSLRSTAAEGETDGSSGIAAGFGKMLGFSKGAGATRLSARKRMPSGSGSGDAPSKAPPPQAPLVKCWSCGVPRDCEYQIRLDASENTDPSPTTPANVDSSPGGGGGGGGGGAPESAVSWQPLDRFCKDRIVAVCDFYVYLSQLRQGLLGKNIPLLGMFRQSTWYRRRMGLARVGSLDLFEDMDCQNVNVLGVRDLETKTITIVR